jgi:hypothetical protein
MVGQTLHIPAIHPTTAAANSARRLNRALKCLRTSPDTVSAQNVPTTGLGEGFSMGTSKKNAPPDASHWQRTGPKAEIW